MGMLEVCWIGAWSFRICLIWW